LRGQKARTVVASNPKPLNLEFGNGIYAAQYGQVLVVVGVVVNPSRMKLSWSPRVPLTAKFPPALPLVGELLPSPVLL
jgi:hypothetical protein